METASHRPVRADRRYLVLADAGVVETDTENEATVSGATLSALEMALAADLESVQRVAARALAELRPLLRAQLHYHLGTSQLRTRQVMLEAQALDR
jgi:DNA repair protein RecO (recombination protein O)